MKIRCELHINGGTRRVLVVAKEEEKIEHVALRLSAAILFWEYGPAMEVSSRHPALTGYDFLPDLMSLDEAGDVNLWVECGNVAVNKISKVTKRLRRARVVVIKENPDEGKRFREVLDNEVARSGAVEIWSWPREDFLRWTRALEESNHVVGESAGRSLNLVLNSVPFAVELLSF